MITAKHPKGETITFEDEDHSYKDSSGQVYKSVTTFIHDFFPPFDTETISAKYASKHNMSQDEVKKQWEMNRDQAAAYGTRVHAFAEAKLKGLPQAEPLDKRDKLAFSAVSDYIDNELLKNYTILEMEKIIFSPSLGLAGTVDLLVKDKQGRLNILDWKTNKEIKYTNSFQSGNPPVSHLQDCNYNHYCLQLNLYKYLLFNEGYYWSAENANLGLLYVNRFPEMTLQFLPVKDMSKEIQDIIGD